MYWHETENLGTTNDGTLYVFLSGEHKLLGDVEDCEDEAAGYGLEAEFSEHLDHWTDSKSCDYAAQVDSDYRLQRI